MTDSKVATQLDYSKHASVEPDYKLTRLTPRQGSADVTVTTTGGTEIHFDIPEKCYNLSRSYLSYDVRCRQVDGKYTFAHFSTIPHIRQIQLYTRGGTMLMDLNHVNNTLNMMVPCDTSLDEFQTLENHDVADTEEKAQAQGQGAMFQKCNALREAFISTTAAERKLAFIDAAGAEANIGGPTNTGDRTAGVLQAVATTAESIKTQLLGYIKPASTNARRHDDDHVTAGTGDISVVSVSRKEQKYFASTGVVGAGGAGGVAGDLYYRVRFPLGLLKNTLASLDKSLFFDEILTMRLVFAESTKIYFTGDDPRAPGEAPIAAVASVTLSNPLMYLAVENNMGVANALRDKVTSGSMSFMTPYPFVYKYASTASTQQNQILRFDLGHGKKLKKIYIAPYNETENKNLAYDHDNRIAADGKTNAKLNSFYTTLDSQRQQEFDITCLNNEDWMLMAPKLKGSQIMNSNQYKYNWVWVEDFTCPGPLWKPCDNTSGGLDLSREKRWEFVGTGAAAAILNWYTIAVCEREVTVSKSGISIQ